MVSRLKIPPCGRFQDGRRAHGHYYKDFVLVVVRYRICTWANQFIWMYCIYCMCGGLEKPVTWSTVFCFLSFLNYKFSRTERNFCGLSSTCTPVQSVSGFFCVLMITWLSRNVAGISTAAVWTWIEWIQFHYGVYLMKWWGNHVELTRF